MKKYLLTMTILLGSMLLSSAQEAPLRLAVAGVTHGHLGEVASRLNRGDFQVVGVFEVNEAYRSKNILTKRLDPSLFYDNLEKMLDETKPEAVCAYGSIYDHIEVVRACAVRGIDVMVEKPLATTYKDALEIKALSEKYGIKVITNYETTWYSSNWHAYRLVQDGTIGDLVRMNIYDGHEGPKELGCSDEFLEWLTDPKLNGGGAVIDFGCYGANIATWFMKGQEPVSVYGVLKQHKPGIYPKVDDDATIVVEYPGMTLQIMASWCWPTSRKDMHIYGHDGSIYQKNPTEMETYVKGEYTPLFKAPKLQAPYYDSFRLLKAVVRDEIKLEPYDPNSLENNIMVVRILEAAKKSAATGKAVVF